MEDHPQGSQGVLQTDWSRLSDKGRAGVRFAVGVLHGLDPPLHPPSAGDGRRQFEAAALACERQVVRKTSPRDLVVQLSQSQ